MCQNRVGDVTSVIQSEGQSVPLMEMSQSTSQLLWNMDSYKRWQVGRQRESQVYG